MPSYRGYPCADDTQVTLRRPTSRSLLAAFVVSVLALLLIGGPRGPVAQAAAAPQPVVAGNQLQDSTTGGPLRVAGVNRSGSEYACVQGWGLFDGPIDDASLAAIAAWGTNTVRLPLNEHCWLGINGVKAAYGGSNYRAAIKDLVSRLHSHGLATILDLHWSAPGTASATEQQIAPDADHAPAFWWSVAETFKDDPSVMFELFNEPRDISWSCWRDGCRTPAGWRATGAQQLVDAVRATGATQPIIIDGLNWGGDLTGWVAHAPEDPQDALVAGWHIYNFSGCSTSACWDATAAPVAQEYPVLLTEVGEDDCAAEFLGEILPWADAHGIGYLAWSWNAASCGAGPALISDYSGTPTAFGAGFKEHLASSAGHDDDAPSGTSDDTDQTSGPGSATNPPDPDALFDFEDGTTEGWGTQWGNLAVRHVTGTAFSGSHGLGLTSSDAGYPAAGVETDPDRVTPGSEITYRLWAPTAVGVTVAPVVFDTGWQVSVLPERSLAPGWNELTFLVPRHLSGVRIIGLQVNNETGWAGSLVLDDVSVTTVRQSFEAGTEGWRTRWGSLEVGGSGIAYVGRRGLELHVPGGGYPAAGTDQVVGLRPGRTVTMRVWAPDDVDVAVAPMVFDQSWRVTVLAGQQLSPGWNVVSFSVPTSGDGVRIVGVQVNNDNAWSGRLVVDAVAW